MDKGALLNHPHLVHLYNNTVLSKCGTNQQVWHKPYSMQATETFSQCVIGHYATYSMNISHYPNNPVCHSIRIHSEYNTPFLP